MPFLQSASVVHVADHELFGKMLYDLLSEGA
jgi:hypothetical protein